MVGVAYGALDGGDGASASNAGVPPAATGVEVMGEAKSGVSTPLRRRSHLLIAVGVFASALFVAWTAADSQSAAAAGLMDNAQSAEESKLAFISSAAPTLSTFSVGPNEAFGLAFDANVTLKSAGWVSFQYRHVDAGTGKPWLWTPWFWANNSASARLFRLRPSTTYQIFVWSRVGEGVHKRVGSTSASTAATGIWAFDEGPLAHVHGNATFQLIATDHAVGADRLSTNWDTFGGPIVLDNDGYVVWYYNFKATGGGGSAQVQDQLSSNYNIVFDSEEDDVKLHEVTPLGEEVSTYTLACDSTNHTTYHSILHECRVDESDSSEPVLTLKNRIVTMKGSKTYQLVDGIGLWHRDSGEYEMKYWLDEYFDLRTARGVFSDEIKSVTCVSGEVWTEHKFEVEDWSHANSVYAHDGMYYVSIRNLDTIAAFAQDGSGLQWTLSANSNVTSNFTFDPPSSRFYSQHDVTVLESGNILLMDNGDTRPGCDAHRILGNCWSRGAEYHLDFDTMVASLVWEFRPDHAEHNSQHLYSKAKGSVSPVDTFSRIVSFSAIVWRDETTKQEYNDTSFYVYQVGTDNTADDDSHNSVESAFMTIPSDLRTGWPYPYRATHRDTIYGETTTMQPYSNKAESW